MILRATGPQLLAAVPESVIYGTPAVGGGAQVSRPGNQSRNRVSHRQLRDGVRNDGSM